MFNSALEDLKESVFNDTELEFGFQNNKQAH